MMKPQPRLVRGGGPASFSPMPAILWSGWLLRSDELYDQIGGTVHVREVPAPETGPEAVTVEAGLIVKGEFKVLASWSLPIR